MNGSRPFEMHAIACDRGKDHRSPMPDGEPDPGPADKRECGQGRCTESEQWRQCHGIELTRQQPAAPSPNRATDSGRCAARMSDRDYVLRRWRRQVWVVWFDWPLLHSAIGVCG